jgi:DNA polymerase III gamma/tau subunit
MSDLFYDQLGSFCDDRTIEILKNLSRTKPRSIFLIGAKSEAWYLEITKLLSAGILCPNSGCGTCETCKAALLGQHRNLYIYPRSSAALSVSQAREIIRESYRAPVDGQYKVLVLPEAHLMDEAAPSLLKTLEEPAKSSIFILAGDQITPKLVTVASRCVLVQIGIKDPKHIEYVTDNDQFYLEREKIWSEIPQKLQESGNQIYECVVKLTEFLDSVVDKSTSLNALKNEAKERGDVENIKNEELLKRELRRIRSDEIKAGLKILIETYKNGLNKEPFLRDVASNAYLTNLKQIEIILDTSRFLAHNPNEKLLLESLFAKLAMAASK